MNKTDLIQKLKALDGLTPDEKAALINLVNTNKKYGLVWEDKPEEVEEQLRKNLPVLREVEEKRILGKEIPTREKGGQQLTLTENLINAPIHKPSDTENPSNPLIRKICDSDNYPNHILIEGDNLHALTALSFTHEGKIDVIYIDPPYNTGNKDFKYNDSFVDKEDSYRHSKWLSFMHKRLQLAKKLLSEKGAIFINIDDNEQAQLKLLCDEIFYEPFFIGNIIWQHSIQGKNDAKTISLHHNYTLIYSNTSFQIGRIPRTELHNKAYSNPDNDPNGLWRSGDVRSPNFRENLRYDITTKSGKKIHPPENGWRWEESTLKGKLSTGEIIFNKDEKKIIRKIYLEKQEGRVVESIWLGNEVGTTRDATAFLKDMFGDSPFDTPKPIELLKRIIQIGGNKSSVILDFFAGSGSTLHAVMQLNAEDGGTRQCILVTNNENNICEEVTYERNKRVIQGYNNAKGEAVAGFTNNSLRYYKSEFVPSNKSEQNRRLLTQASTDLLCIKEDCFTDITKANGFSDKQCRLFTNDNAKYLVVVYHSRNPLAVCEQLIAFIKTINTTTEKVRLYGFSPEKETLVEDFYEVADKIEAVPLPDAIYNAYRATFRVLKLDKKMVAKPTEPTATEATLFDNNEAEA